MFNFGGLEILVILVVALLVLGPEKLPGFMRVVGRFMGEARRASTEFQRSINTSMGEDADTTKLADSATPVPAAPAPDTSRPSVPDALHATPERHASSRSHPRPDRKLNRVIRRPGRTRHGSDPTETP